MCRTLTNTAWRRASAEGYWLLTGSVGWPLATLQRGPDGRWEGRVPPRISNHLKPLASLQVMMRQAEQFVRDRDGVKP